MIRLVSVALALVLLCVGGAAFWQALDHLKPEYRGRQKMFAFAAPSWYSSDGQRLLRRGWLFQVIGLALISLILLLG